MVLPVSTARTAWNRLGKLPAFPVTAAFFALALLAGLTLGGTAASIVGLILFAALVIYCAARESQGSDLFWMIAAPNALSILAHEAFGAPRWLAIVLLPFVLWGAWRMDRRPAFGSTGDAAASSNT
jgi:hypothetical protein